MLPTLVLATATAPTTLDTTTASSVSTSSLLFQLVIALAVILAIIAIITKVARGRMGPVKRGTIPLSVVGRQQLGKGVQVAIVRAGSETFLLGVTPHQITRISRFDGLPEELLESSDDLPGAAPAPPFVRWQSMLRQIQERTVRRA